MPSPFPGMDPYLEDPAFWRGFHGRLIYALTDQLLDRLPQDYDADVDEQVRLVEVSPEELAARRKDAIPDVAVMRGPASAESRARHPGQNVGDGSAGDGGSVATMEPVTITVQADREEKDRWIKIIHRPDDALVTIIEVLSPTNKNGDGYAEYRAKRNAILRQHVNLVELDLLLGGRRMEDPARLPAGDYFAVVQRAETPSHRQVYSWPLRRPMPPIDVPLRPPAPDVRLDLSAALATAYDGGRYGRRLRYHAPPVAPVPAHDVPWAEELARSQR